MLALSVSVRLPVGEVIDGPALTVQVTWLVEALLFRASVTVATTLYVPAVVGVPVIFPVPSIDRPGGRPVADQVYGVTPLDAVTCTAVAGTVASPFCAAGVAFTVGTGLMVQVNAAVL